MMAHPLRDPRFTQFLGEEIVRAEQGDKCAAAFCDIVVATLRRENRSRAKVEDARIAADKLARMLRARKMPYNAADIIERK